MNMQSLPFDDGDNELQRVVARIRARKSALPLIRPDPAVLAAIMARIRNEVPLSAEELAEHEREWRAVEAELRAVERSDAYRDRRV